MQHLRQRLILNKHFGSIVQYINLSHTNSNVIFLYCHYSFVVYNVHFPMSKKNSRNPIISCVLHYFTIKPDILRPEILLLLLLPFAYYLYNKNYSLHLALSLTHNMSYQNSSNIFSQIADFHLVIALHIHIQ